MKLQFLGGAQTVTGSKTLVSYGRQRSLVDCGLFQGLKELRLRNWNQFPVALEGLQSILLTHAHLDHSGYLPLIVREGYRGPIYCTEPTRALTELILLDSARLQEEDADFANRHGYSKHHPALPLYQSDDVHRALDRLVVVRPEEWKELPGGARFRLVPNGHILGSTWVEFEAEGARVIFSGDLGRARPLLLPPAASAEGCDYLVMESTYGDRLHEETDPLDTLAEVICGTYAKKGQVLIPSFAVGRAQDVLWLLAQLKRASRIPALPIYLDSPMGVNATRLFLEYPRWHALDERQIHELMGVAQMVTTKNESIAVMRSDQPAVVIAGSGMVSGGRILHHLEAHLGDPRSAVVLVGFQAQGTRGHLLKEGVSELKMHGRYIPVRARIVTMNGLSAHADQGEIVKWLGGFRRPPQMTFLNHGEPQAADVLRVKLADTLQWKACVPRPMEEFELSL